MQANSAAAFQKRNGFRQTTLSESAKRRASAEMFLDNEAKVVRGLGEDEDECDEEDENDSNHEQLAAFADRTDDSGTDKCNSEDDFQAVPPKVVQSKKKKARIGDSSEEEELVNRRESKRTRIRKHIENMKQSSAKQVVPSSSSSSDSNNNCSNNKKKGTIFAPIVPIKPNASNSKQQLQKEEINENHSTVSNDNNNNIIDLSDDTPVERPISASDAAIAKWNLLSVKYRIGVFKCDPLNLNRASPELEVKVFDASHAARLAEGMVASPEANVLPMVGMLSESKFYTL